MDRENKIQNKKINQDFWSMSTVELQIKQTIVASFLIISYVWLKSMLH